MSKRLNVHVIGAGIAGPMAALIQARNGNVVDVYERRAKDQLVSDGILGITHHNWERMTQRGVNLGGYELPNKFTNIDSGVTSTSEYHYITWTDLHEALTDAAVTAGAIVHYETDYESRDDNGAADLIIVATGVGQAKDVSQSRYTGYVIYRGFSPLKAGTNWSAGHYAGELGQFAFMVGDTNEGASITMFVPRDEVASFSTNLTATAPDEVNDLPTSWWSLASHVAIWQYTPMSDWSVPRRMTRHSHGWHQPNTIRIGDANGQLRPATSMGANLAIEEALHVDDILGADFVEFTTLLHRQAWKEWGESVGV